MLEHSLKLNHEKIGENFNYSYNNMQYNKQYKSRYVTNCMVFEICRDA